MERGKEDKVTVHILQLCPKNSNFPLPFCIVFKHNALIVHSSLKYKPGSILHLLGKMLGRSELGALPSSCA